MGTEETETEKYPQVRGDLVIFGKDSMLERKLEPILLEHVSEDEYKWLVDYVKGRGLSLGSETSQPYEVVRNTKTAQVAIKFLGIPAVDIQAIKNPRYYSGVVFEIKNLSYSLNKHREGIETGWGDALLTDL